MLKPLDSEVLAALQSPDKYAGCARVSSAKYKLGENKDVRNCVYALLQVYSTTFEARLRWKGDDVNNRWVDFRVR